MTTDAPRHQRPSRLGSFLFGVAYYPEHWTEEERRDDPRRMALAGVNVVRMAEFAWDRIEPQRNLFDFSLFDETIAQLGKAGINTILCTPTAAPPAWLTADHEEWMRVDASGRRMAHGSRQHCCTNNPEFRAESRRITSVMAEHYAGNPHVIGWQTDNELFCHIRECYCDACRAAFRSWLLGQYHTIDALNAAWGTAFWSQTYRSFEQVGFPFVPERPTYPNPGQQLDYYRFLSDALCEFQREQAQILRAANPRWFVTHNGMMPRVDYWEFAKELDFLGVDVYPGFSVRGPADCYGPALALERCRAASGAFIVPEQQSGAGGQRPYLHETPRPNQMRLWTYQSIGHGADGVLHFRWRTCRFGAEMYWNGILDHDNVSRRRFRELCREGDELARIAPIILGTVNRVDVGVLVEHDQDAAHDTMSLGLPTPSHVADCVLTAMFRRHLPAGFVCSEDSFDGLTMLVTPSFPLIDQELAMRLRRFVENGGTLVATARTATRDRNNRVLAQTPPGPLAGLFGMTVTEFGILSSPLVILRSGETEILPGGAYEVLNLDTAQPLAVWGPAVDSGPHAAAQQPGIAVHKFGKGKAIYIGTYVTDANVEALLDILLGQTPITAMAVADPFVEVTCRRSDTVQLHFVLNHYPLHKTARGLPRGKELISGGRCDGVVELEPYGAAIVRSA